MARSARRPEPRRRAPVVVKAIGYAGSLVFANPVTVGSATAFLVAFSFVSANALWYQPSRHNGAFFATRVGAIPDGDDVAAQPETTIRIEREADVEAARAAARIPDPVLLGVQQALAQRGVYSGTVDGLSGPQTRSAIEAFRSAAGLPAGNAVDAALLERLNLKRPAPIPRPREGLDRTATSAVATPDPVIVQIQAGLRAFGNDGIALDGVPGSKTRAAIREFQSLFGLTADGEPSEAVLAKMKAVGLVN